MSTHIPLTTGAVVSHNSRILASAGNPTSYVQTDGNGNMSSILAGQDP